MADHATSSYGVDLLTAADNATQPADNTFTSLAQIIDESMEDGETKQINATHLNQSDRYMRSKPGMIDAGTLKIKIHYNGLVYSTLHTAKATGTIKWWFVKIPVGDGTNYDKFYLRGYVKTLGRESPADGDGMTADLEVQAIGGIVVTAYTP